MTSNSRQSSSRSARAAALVGKTIADFEILEEIGRGGMGVVFRARQISLDRIVAFKILSSALGMTDQAIARFRREAQATAKLQHPNIVPVYAQGQEDDTYFYAMALVEGRSLHDIITDLREGRRPRGRPAPRSTPHGWSVTKGSAELGSAAAEDPALAETRLLEHGSGGAGGADSSSDAADTGQPDATASRTDRTVFERHTEAYFDEIARQIGAVADALDYAHRHGVIHRDIKPHNLLVGDDDRLCLSDFGLARVLEQPGVTMTGERVGSPLYMAPEQLTGRGGAVGKTADVYSLGATLYEWLTLSPPYPGQTREEVISRVLTSEPVPPRALNNRVPVDLETICIKALETDPARRYQAAGEMRDDLKRFVDRAGIKARRAGLAASVFKTIGKRRVAATVVGAAIAVSFLSWQLFRERRQVRKTEQVVATKQKEVEAVLEENVKLQQEKSELADVIARRMKQGEALYAELTRQGSVLAGLLSTEEEPAEYAPVSDAQRIGAMSLTALRESQMRRLQNTDPQAIESGSAEEHYLKALVEESAEAALSHVEDCLAVFPTHVGARLLRAWIHCQVSDTEKMLADAEAVLETDPHSGEAHLVRAAAHLLMYSFEEARADLSEAARSADRDFRLDILTGVVLAGLGRNDAAIVALSPALLTNPDCVLGLMKRAELSYAGGRYVAAIIDLTKVLEKEPQNAAALEKRGECYDKLKRYDEAINDYAAALGVSRSTVLAAKAAAAAVNRDKQRMDREAQETAMRQSETEPKSGPQKALEPPDSPSGVEEWLEKFLESRESDEDTQSLRPHPVSLKFTHPLAVGVRGS